jgi:hypothetical protein
MANHHWSLVCQRAIVDRFTNQLSLFNVIEQVHTARPPDTVDKKRTALMPVNWHVVSYLSRSRSGIPERFNIVCVIRGPNGKPIGESTQEIVMDKHDKMRSISYIPNIPFVGVGDYRVVIFYEKDKKRRKLDEIVIPVNFLEQTAGKAPSPRRKNGPRTGPRIN